MQMKDGFLTKSLHKTSSLLKLPAACSRLPRLLAARQWQACAAESRGRLTAATEAESFKKSLKPMKCTTEVVDGTLKLTVVSGAFEGKSGKRREKLVLQALGNDLLAEDVDGLGVIAMTPKESAAALKKWC